ncbi:aromatic ring-hydroxylating oxygenase subunit alpha [Sphingomonas sp. ERG5]|uniref:aromatic ring-hydroxylating oxygenase subunit alpha n=1 Tax=Sphingomonas sp. ERG5 TaxID=1381597 RepID=UPI0009E082F6|nr:aromatic ring-hydroxylating dioxygenase subunit alpha [Sphingomonas sp. ERG5]
MTAQANPSVPATLEALYVLTRAPIAAAVSLPPACYVDPGFLAVERERLFAREWLCIGRAADMPVPGDYLSYDSAIGPVMAVRQKDGSVATLSRSCRHRGALLGSDGAGTARLFVCPYHKWTYELDGTLIGAPTMHRNPAFDRAACSLPRFRTEVWQGFVFFNANPDAPELAPRLTAVSELCARHGLDALESRFAIDEKWDANWKVAFENSCETYHHMGVHTATLEPVFPTLGVVCEDGGDLHNLHYAPANPGFAFDAPPGDATLLDDDLRRLVILGIYPNLVIAFSGATATWFRFTPITADTTTLHVGWLTPVGHDPLRLEQEHATVERILLEDRISCAAVQRGLAGRDASQGPLSPLERPIAEFARYLAGRLAVGETVFSPAEG